VKNLGANVMRSGLAAALAFLERRKDRAPFRRLLDDLAWERIPGFSGGGAALPDRIRKLEVDDYMFATRELLKLAQWLKRAVQAGAKED
jgi:CRISPR-associated protein Cmr5